MPVALQVKMLRVLEDGQITPVGAIQPKELDVRVIAATNSDLHAQIAKGVFRQDLYFRLARYRIDTPPLRKRLDDVPTLVMHFLARFAVEMGLKTPPLSAEAMAVLQAYSFPGNVRELRNIIERALIESNGDPIAPEHLHLYQTGPQPAAAPVEPTVKAEWATALPLNLAEAEDLLIQRALRETNGNIADAARLLGVHRTRIYRKLAVEEAGAEKQAG
jgi:DNA-binding NtrC family response regulator